MQKQKGFTIIELIVVIAIIAVLASIVMVNVVSYINKSKDAQIKANMNVIRTETTAAASDVPTTLTTSTIASSTAWAQITATSGSGNVFQAVNTITQNWCACARLVSDTTKYFCVDSSGSSKETTTACSTSNCGNSTTPACP